MKITKLFIPVVVGGMFAFTLATPASADVSYDLNGWDTSDTRAKGHLEITAEGLHIWTDDSSSAAKVAAYRTAPEGTNLTNVGTPAIDWTGSDPAPGLQLVLDIPGGTGVDGILVGESVYGNNWWLSNSASDALKDKAPHKGGGSGSQWFGTLAEWSESLNGQGWIRSVGFSLGSGVKGDGVIKSLTFRGEKYTFQPPEAVTPEAPTTTAPTCDKAAEVKLPEVGDDAGYGYSVEIKGSTATVEAKAKTGFVIAKDAKDTWTLELAGKLTGEQCQPEGTPTPTPSQTTVPTPTPTATQTPGATGGLPVTGPGGRVLGALGLGVIAAGAILVVGLRRRRTRFEA